MLTEIGQIGLNSNVVNSSTSSLMSACVVASSSSSSSSNGSGSNCRTNRNDCTTTSSSSLPSSLSCTMLYPEPTDAVAQSKNFGHSTEPVLTVTVTVTVERTVERTVEVPLDNNRAFSAASGLGRAYCACYSGKYSRAHCGGSCGDYRRTACSAVSLRRAYCSDG